MKHYRVLLEGTGINVEFEPGKVVRGFFVTRFVSAVSANEAGEKALSLVRKSLVTDPTSLSFRSAQLSVSEVQIVGILARLKGVNKGFTFYAAQ